MDFKSIKDIIKKYLLLERALAELLVSCKASTIKVKVPCKEIENKNKMLKKNFIKIIHKLTP